MASTASLCVAVRCSVLQRDIYIWLMGHPHILGYPDIALGPFASFMYCTVLQRDVYTCDIYTWYHFTASFWGHVMFWSLSSNTAVCCGVFENVIGCCATLYSVRYVCDIPFTASFWGHTMLQCVADCCSVIYTCDSVYDSWTIHIQFLGPFDASGRIIQHSAMLQSVAECCWVICIYMIIMQQLAFGAIRCVAPHRQVRISRSW